MLGETLRTLRASAEATREPYEIIVADDASTDRTADIARAAGATVVSVNRRQIAAVRNAGAKVARGGVLVFVDADTQVSADTLRQARQALDSGAVGGGAPFRFEPHTPAWGHVAGHLSNLVMRMMSWAAGSFVFVRRDAFEAVGGFDERYFALEEVVLSRALQRRGRMVLVRAPVLTSGRKAHFYTAREVWSVAWMIITRGRSAVQQRHGLDVWYDGKR